MRINILDKNSVPAKIYSYESPFKNISYRVRDSGEITLEIVMNLDFLSYDIEKAKKVSSLKGVGIEIYDYINGEEHRIRSLEGLFKEYLLEERPGIDGEMIREERILFEITKIH